jgi:hypothetical protein
MDVSRQSSVGVIAIPAFDDGMIALRFIDKTLPAFPIIGGNRPRKGVTL